MPDGFVRGGVTYRILTDHLGSVRYVLDAQTGDVVQRMEYDAYGRVILDTNPGFQPFAFAGGLYDPQTGLVRFGARDYDPETGRWTTKDPILFPGGGTNLYGYTLGDPVNLADVDGLQPERYSGMMREYVENPALAQGNIQAAQYALLALGAMAGGYAIAEVGYCAMSACLANPIACNAAAVAVGDAATGGVTGVAPPVTKVFWAGGELAENAANAWAKANRGETLGMTAIGCATAAATEGLDYLTVGRPAFAKVSREFARSASGEVHVFTSGEMTLQSLLLTDELPVLIENPNVTNIVVHRVRTGGGVVSP